MTAMVMHDATLGSNNFPQVACHDSGQQSVHTHTLMTPSLLSLI